MTFAPVENWLKKTRYEYKDLAKHLGLSRPAISLWKSRNAVPEKHVLRVKRLLKTKNGLN